MFKLGIIVVGVLMIFSAEAYAGTIQLSPNGSKSMTNHTPWTVSATCQVQGSAASSKIVIQLSDNSGTVNGRNITKGHATSVNVRNNQRIVVSAEPGTTVNLVNRGTESVSAICSV